MKLAWLFPGQGTQHVSMGKALFDASQAARKVFERADAALGWKLSALMFEGPEAELTLTKNTQPAVVTASIAALEALREAKPDLASPDYVAGHSLGEYSALVAAEALSLEDAVRLVHRRGQAMQDAVPEGRGAMAALMGADRAAVEDLCREAADGAVVSAANFNAPGQIVIAGDAEAVERARGLAAARKMKAIPLKVSAPFHCALMAPAAEIVRQALSDVTVKDPTVPVVSNVTGKPATAASEVSGLLVRQIDGPVLWQQSVSFMANEGVTQALEIGPGKVLAGLVKRSDKRVAVQGVSDPASVAKALELLQ